MPDTTEPNESDVVTEYQALVAQEEERLTTTGPNPTFEEYIQARLFKGYFGAVDKLSDRLVKGSGTGEPRGIRNA